MTKQEIKLKLQNILTPKRFTHSLGVMETAVSLAARYGQDEEKAALAGLLHDCARDIKGEKIFEMCERFNIKFNDIEQMQPELLHGPIGAALAREEYGIEDEDILRAIYCHTTGREYMSVLDKIIFIADYIEPARDFPGVDEVRRIAYEDLNKSMLISLENIIRHVISKGVLIHPDTVNARNCILKEKMS